MPKPFDATLKDLAGLDPVRFLAEFDTPPALPVRLLNVDLSTVTAATDIAFGLGDPLQEIVHLDAQAGPDADKHLDLLAYNALLHRQYRVPVHSILLLLRPQAQHSNQTGEIRYSARPDRGKMEYGYEIVRVWQRPAEALLASGLATLPLATLGQMPAGVSVEDGMRRVVDGIVQRLQQEGKPELTYRLLTASLVLGGLRVEKAQLRTIFQGVRAMRESAGYQLILDEGRAEGAQRILLHQGRQKLGEPDEATQRALKDIDDLDRLDRMSIQLLKVETWTELLQTP
jgi:hypothetical protein